MGSFGYRVGQTVGTVVLRVQQDGVERRITVEELEARIRAGELSPEEPVCVDGRWSAARDWPSWDTLRASPEAAMRALWAQRPVPWVTAITLGVLFQVHVFTIPLALRGHTGWLEALTRDTTAILERGEGWRLLTYGMLHANVEHILGNAAALAIAGMGLEKLLGARATLLTLLVTTALGGSLSAVFLPDITSAGISGGDFGLMAACAILGIRFGDSIPGNARVAFGAVAALFTAYTFFSTAFGEHVDTWCHLGGLLGGLVIGAAYRPRIPAWEPYNRAMDAAMAGVLVLLCAGPILIGPKLVPWTEWKADGAIATRPAWWSYQVSRSGLGGYGNADRSSAVSVDTTRHGVRSPNAAVFAERLEALRTADSAATMESQGEDRALFHYNPGGEQRVLELRVVQRGLYVTTFGVDTRVGAPMAPELRLHTLESPTLTPPDAVVDDLEGAGSPGWKGRLAAAIATAELGDLAAAAPLFTAARQNGDSASVDIAELGVYAALGEPDTRAKIDAALAAHPDDRRVLAAAARAWALLGDQDRAASTALELYASAPSDRSRRVAEDLLEELGVPVPPAPVGGASGEPSILAPENGGR